MGSLLSYINPENLERSRILSLQLESVGLPIELFQDVFDRSDYGEQVKLLRTCKLLNKQLKMENNINTVTEFIRINNKHNKKRMLWIIVNNDMKEQQMFDKLTNENFVWYGNSRIDNEIIKKVVIRQSYPRLFNNISEIPRMYGELVIIKGIASEEIDCDKLERLLGDDDGNLIKHKLLGKIVTKIDYTIAFIMQEPPPEYLLSYFKERIKIIKIN